ncbi:alpha/beta-hydrolase [Schizopora paradoxa]|uniref:Alpha/beta-hydrolase n=1 Tax=Schizopora paradoxa TaxID=27342 RepID=A0A0H2S721_9AGAM|nr:alpha/beta-hydrolase [Schizopora paradoxa]
MLSAPSLEGSPVIKLSSTEVSSYKPYTLYSSIAYCSPSIIGNWSCGGNCDALAGFSPTFWGGDGTDTQYWYVGFDRTLNTVVVAHQGTRAKSLYSLVIDLNVFMTPLNSTLFPGLPSSIAVHSGFADSHARIAEAVLSAVNMTLTMHASLSPSVTLTGHSLGAALSLLDAIYLSLHLPDSTRFKYVGFGLPRVGNQEFANYVDDLAVRFDSELKNGTSFTRITDKRDLIPINPGKFMGFRHPRGEVHIDDSDEWNACPGQDNPSSSCIVGQVPTDFEGRLSDHHGPYDGVYMNC